MSNHYTYTDHGFEPASGDLIDYETVPGSSDMTAIYHANGWEKMESFGGDGYFFTIDIMHRGRGNDSSKLVELWAETHLIWMVLVPGEHWPRFFRNEILPVLNSAFQGKLSDRVEVLSNALITIGNSGVGRNNLDPEGHDMTEIRRNRDEWRQKKEQAS